MRQITKNTPVHAFAKSFGGMTKLAAHLGIPRPRLYGWADRWPNPKVAPASAEALETLKKLMEDAA